MNTFAKAMIVAAAFCGVGGAVSAHEDHKTAPAMHELIFNTDGSCAALTQTWNLDRVAETFRAMPQSSRMNMQHILRHAGLYEGADDGIWGKGTECAMAHVLGDHERVIMTDENLVKFFEYMLDGGFISEYSGTPNAIGHPGVIY